MTDELTSLRTFRADLAEPGPETLARVRARLDSRLRRPHRPGRGRLVPAIAATAVLAVAGGAALVGSQFAGESGPRPATHQAAVELLERFADAAGTGPAPLTVPAGKVLYVSCHITYAGAPRPGQTPTKYRGETPIWESRPNETWFDVQGMITLLTIALPTDTSPEHRAASAAIANQERAAFARHGPGLARPTPEFLAGLPNDPQAMLALLRTLTDENDLWSGSPFNEMMYQLFFRFTEPLITPRVRAALYRTLATLDSVVATGEPIEFNGRNVHAISQTTPNGTRFDLLLDATTGRAVGMLVFGSQSGPEPVMSQWCTHAVVNKAGDTS